MTQMHPITIDCFKAYDVRGKLGSQLNDEVAYRIGRAFAEHLNAKTCVIGSDIRPTSETLKASVIQGMLDAGADVIDLGMTGSEEVYFATSDLDACGGIEGTASHNPIDYNGLKFVREGSRPIGEHTGLGDIQQLAQNGHFKPASQGKLTHNFSKTRYVDHLMSFIDTDKLKPMTIVVNPGNGSAGPTLEALEEKLSPYGISFIRVNFSPDGSFPNGIPNPMLTANRLSTAQAVVSHGADFGVAFDGDFDRCFFFDSQGEFIEGYYVVGLLAAAFLTKGPAAIAYDPRLVWNTEAVVEAGGGTPVLSPSGHSNLKEAMRTAGAVYGGEMSAHHYFEDFFYCDSGMVPWLLVLELLSQTELNLADLVKSYQADYPSPGEINYRLSDLSPAELIAIIQAHYLGLYPDARVMHVDGVSMDMGEWRFNLRASNTEPLIRLNLETRADAALMTQKYAEIEALIIANGGTKA